MPICRARIGLKHFQKAIENLRIFEDRDTDRRGYYTGTSILCHSVQGYSISYIADAFYNAPEPCGANHVC